MAVPFVGRVWPGRTPGLLPATKGSYEALNAEIGGAAECAAEELRRAAECLAWDPSAVGLGLRAPGYP